MSDIVESWLWRNPAEIIERMLERSARRMAAQQGLDLGRIEISHHDRYYTMARRIKIRSAMKQVMRGER